MNENQKFEIVNFTRYVLEYDQQLIVPDGRIAYVEFGSIFMLRENPVGENDQVQVGLPVVLLKDSSGNISDFPLQEKGKAYVLNPRQIAEATFLNLRGYDMVGTLAFPVKVVHGRVRFSGLVSYAGSTEINLLL